MIVFRVLFINSDYEKTKLALIFVSHDVENLVFVIVNNLLDLWNVKFLINIENIVFVNVQALKSIWQYKSFLWIIGFEEKRWIFESFIFTKFLNNFNNIGTIIELNDTILLSEDEGIGKVFTFELRCEVELHADSFQVFFSFF